MDRNVIEGTAGFAFVARRNDSLTAHGRFIVLASLAAVVFAIATGFACFGAWLVFPFAGLDVLAVFLAFRYVEKRAGDFECIGVYDDKIVIERERQGTLERYEMNRYWVQISLVAGLGGERSRILLRSHGREVAFGEYLGSERCAVLARRLREHLDTRSKSIRLGEA